MDHDEGLQIISDGTAEGTYLIIDGKPMLGLTDVRWKIDPINRQAEICLSLSDLKMSAHKLPPGTMSTLETVMNSLVACLGPGKEESLNAPKEVQRVPLGVRRS